MSPHCTSHRTRTTIEKESKTTPHGNRDCATHCRVVEAKAMEKPKTRHDEWGGVGNAKGTVL